MLIKTSELTGRAIDWAVLKCLLGDAAHYTWEHTAHRHRYSTDWTQGGPIIERERIGAEPWGGDAFWVAMTYSEAGMTLHKHFGPTPLIAAMRCYVAFKLGDEVEVPDELQVLP